MRHSRRRRHSPDPLERGSGWASRRCPRRKGSFELGEDRIESEIQFLSWSSCCIRSNAFARQSTKRRMRGGTGLPGAKTA